MKVPSWANDEKMTDSQIVRFKDAPGSQAGAPAARGYQDAVSVIGETLHFKGELSAEEDLIIEGKVEGKINQGTCCLTLKPNGKIHADVNATKIYIEGEVKGDLHATESVTVRRSGNVSGNIVAPKVAVDEGATFNGSIEMRTPSQDGKKK